MVFDLERAIFAFGAITAIVGAVALWCSSRMVSKLILEHKYFKNNAMNTTMPWFFLVVFGALVATLPLLTPLMTKKDTPASINVTVLDNPHGKTLPKKPFKNKVILLVPIDKDGKPATVALSLLVDTAKCFSSAKQSPKIFIATSIQDSCEKKEADKAAKYVVELLVTNGIKNCEIDHKAAVKVEQAGSCLCVTIQGKD